MMKWQGLSFIQVPDVIPELSASATHVYMVLLQLANRNWRSSNWPKRYDELTEIPVAVTIGEQQLANKTELSLPTIERGIRELKNYGLIQADFGFRKRGQRKKNTYTFRLDGKPLFRRRRFTDAGEWRRIGKSMLENVNHFTVPVYVVGNILPHLTASEKKLYATLLFLLKYEKTPAIRATASEIRNHCGLGRDAFRAALEKLCALELCSRNPEKQIVMHDPESRTVIGTLPRENFRKYVRKDGSAFEILAAFKADPEMFLSKLDISGIKQSRSGDELYFCCPFHDDFTPSASINVNTGLWMCHAGKHLHNRGNLPQLVRWRKVGKEDVSAGAAIAAHQAAAEAMGEILMYTERSYFQTLMDDGTVYYDYFYPDGKRAFRKFRIEKDGSKRFVIFRWNEDTQRFALSNGMYKTPLPRLLYRWPTADTQIVMICEGEKDVERLECEYEAERPVILVTTSGGSTSWDDSLADCFHAGIRRIYLFRDNDESGRRFADEVRESLQKRNIACVDVDLEDAHDISDYLKGLPAEKTSKGGIGWDEHRPLVMASPYEFYIDCVLQASDDSEPVIPMVPVSPDSLAVAVQ